MKHEVTIHLLYPQETLVATLSSPTLSPVDSHHEVEPSFSLSFILSRQSSVFNCRRTHFRRKLHRSQSFMPRRLLPCNSIVDEPSLVVNRRLGPSRPIPNNNPSRFFIAQPNVESSRGETRCPSRYSLQVILSRMQVILRP